jgi:hypothetical protein
MTSIVIETGVVAEFEGKYWGVVHEGGGHGDPEYCTKPTSFTYEHSPYYAVLARAKLVTLKKTIHYEVDA